MDFKIKIMGVFLVFVTGSLLLGMDFKSQTTYVFGELGIDLEEIGSDGLENILSHLPTETFNLGYYTYPKPETIENKISEEKYEKLTNIIDLEKEEKAIVIRGYEVDDYITARYYIDLNDEKSLDDIVKSYQDKLTNSGYEEQEGEYIKENISIKFLVKWDCITLIVKGL